MARNHRRKSCREPSEEYTPVEQEEVRPKYRVTLAYIIDEDEVNELVEASYSAYVELPNATAHHSNYPTYMEEETISLVNGDFRPRKLKKVIK